MWRGGRLERVHGAHSAFPSRTVPDPWTVQRPRSDREDRRDFRFGWSTPAIGFMEIDHESEFATPSDTHKRTCPTSKGGGVPLQPSKPLVCKEGEAEAEGTWPMERSSAMARKALGRSKANQADPSRRWKGAICKGKRTSERTDVVEQKNESIACTLKSDERGAWMKLAACSAAVLGVLSLDQQTGQWFHRAVEIPLHDVLQERIDVEWHTYWVGELLSNVPIRVMLPLFLFQTGWRLLGQTSLSDKCLGGLGIAFYLFVAGYIPHHDVLVVQMFKEHFMKERPIASPSFAFPSGHTTAAAYLSGMLSFGSRSAVPSSWSELSAKFPALLVDEQGKSCIRRGCWLAPIALVASGRVLSERHWLGDTLAGACLGTCAVFTLLSIHAHLVQSWFRDS